MKNFRITVNGNTYEVGVEEVGTSDNSSSAAPSPAPQKSAPSPKPQSQPSKPTPKKESKPEPTPEPVVEGGQTIESPMPGTILDIKVGVGDSVNDGDVLLILEAMKMENEIMAEGAGKVAAINVKNGDSVDSGDVLIVIE